MSTSKSGISDALLENVRSLFHDVTSCYACHF